MKIIINLNQCHQVILNQRLRLVNPKKATTHNISPKIVKSSSEATFNVFRRLFNETISAGVFLDNLKLADVTPVFKKDYPFDLSPFYRLYLKFIKTDAKTNKELYQKLFISSFVSIQKRLQHATVFDFSHRTMDKDSRQ